jgi:DNA repair protein RecN (Recombination protein N)
MLRKLSIKNYALIDELSLDFEKGFTVITGETGSGKSILLGAMGLILGNRSDSNVIHQSGDKCIVEAEFDIADYNLKPLFKEEDLDYAAHSIFRREVLSSGRSRAFVNDTPVSLSLMKNIGSKLVDIHSQHDVIMLKNNSIQLNALDAFAKNEKLRKKYLASFLQWEKLKKDYDQLKNAILSSNMDKDYIDFQLQELVDANLKTGEKEKLEQDQNIAESAEDVNEVFTNDEHGILNQTRTIENALSKISDKSERYQELSDRIKSVRLEVLDLQNDLGVEESSVEVDPAALNKIQERLDLLYRLENKHRVGDVDELIQVEEKLSNSLFEADQLEKRLKSIEKELKEEEIKLTQLAEALTASRANKIPSFEKKATSLLKSLSLNKARVKVHIEEQKSFGRVGKDHVNFLFNANSGGSLQELGKVASGGELSRVMLAIKSILADTSGLPVLIFDEIDTGISGKVSGMVAKMMVKISEARQVFSITHQAQVASLGNCHYKVSKAESKNRTVTSVELLDKKSRVKEIAEMLSGQSISEHSLANATELLAQDV